MEELKKKIRPNNYQTVTEDLMLFDWVVVSSTFDSHDETYHVVLQRDDTTSYYEQIKDLERQWNDLAKQIPLWPIAFFLIPAFLFVTIYFAIEYAGLYEWFNSTAAYCAFFIPAGVLIALAVVYTAVRAYSYNKKVKNNDLYRQQIIDKVHALKGEVTNEEVLS